jgi:26S proteasome regulatory subunit N6
MVALTTQKDGPVDARSGVVEELLKDMISWTREEKRTFLRLRLELKLAEVYYKNGKFQASLEILTSLNIEAKKQDDKRLVTEMSLVESRVHQALENWPKAKASLIVAKTNANAIYCPPLLQAEIDRQAGELFAEENDYKTAYSYFFEA